MLDYILETQWIWIVATHISLAGYFIYAGEKNKWEDSEFPWAEQIILSDFTKRGAELGGELRKEIDNIKRVSGIKKNEANRNSKICAVVFVISLFMIGVSA